MRGDAWVSVSVATLWRSPDAPRDLDAPALARPARIREWLAGMTTEERRGLNGRADTQLLLGDRVRVLRLGPDWARVRVPDQPVPDMAGGYRGWLPRRQLTARAPVVTDEVATIVTATAELRRGTGATPAVLEVSFGTHLPSLGADGGAVRVALPSGRTARVAADAVARHAPDDSALAATPRSLVRHARLFLGLDYLWAGRSGFGLDCSGLTSLVHRVHGLDIPRDAAPQATGGTAVARQDLRRGDLVFFAEGGTVHHVGMYAGKGRMIHAPGTGQQVQLTDLDASPYDEQYAGGRRYLQ